MRFWDTSALVPVLLNETDTPRRLEQIAEDPSLAVWWATLAEAESAIQRRSRERSMPPDSARTARMRLAELAAIWSEVPPSPALRTLAVRLLRTHPLRAADALQLAAALSVMHAGSPGLAFVTGDDRLANAAEIEGLTLLR